MEGERREPARCPVCRARLDGERERCPRCLANLEVAGRLSRAAEEWLSEASRAVEQERLARVEREVIRDRIHLVSVLQGREAREAGDSPEMAASLAASRGTEGPLLREAGEAPVGVHSAVEGEVSPRRAPGWALLGGGVVFGLVVGLLLVSHMRLLPEDPGAQARPPVAAEEPAPPVTGIDDEVYGPGVVEEAPEGDSGEPPGAVLKETPTPAAVLEETPTPAAVLEETPTSTAVTGPPVPPPPSPDVYIIVRPGDSLWSVSRELWGRGARYSLLMEANDLTSDLIRPGQWLRVPGEADL